MLPSSGYFRDLVCPFLKLGLCERTHCHYKHELRQPIKPSSAVQRSKSHASLSASLPVYVPTPVAKLKCGYQRSDTKSGDDTRVKHSAKSSDNIPVYKPTPISELKKKQIGSYGQTSSDDIKSNLDDGSNSSKIVKNEKKTAVSDVIKDSAVPLGKERKESDNNLLKSKKIKTDISGDKSSSSSKNNNKCTTDDKKSKLKTKQKLEKSDSKAKSSDKVLIDLTDDSDEHFYETSTKKIRIAHNAMSAVAIAKLEKKEKRLNPSQVMRQRFIATQTNDKSNGDLHAKVYAKTSEPKMNSSSDSAEEVGNSATGKKRIAHKPAPVSSSSVKRPTMPIHFGNKVPMKMRQLYLSKFIDEFLEFCADEDAYKRGSECEQAIYEKSKSSQLYKVFSASEVAKIRSEAANEKTSASSAKQSIAATNSHKLGNYTVSHQAILNGRISGTFSIEKRQKSLQIDDLNDCELYKMLSKYIMTESQLKEYGYPRVDPNNKGCAILAKPDANKIKNNYESRARNCSRCKKLFQVNEDEMPVRRETCIYHCGRLWNERFNKSIERKYSCCKNDAQSDGCCSNPYHIIDGFDRPQYCQNYTKTLPKKPPPLNGYYGIYGLDCEMCYTTHGLELTRVTVVNSKLQTVYETLVKPSHPILDYNTKFSGIKDGDLKKVTTTIADVQTRLTTLFNDKTILIGHSLESDLKALKMIHDTVVDTAQVFPHRRGLPYKRALRTLTAEFLLKIIQNDVEGHDSCEDALAALKLMLWKVTEDLKKLKR